jgi:hypothetical protein
MSSLQLSLLILAVVLVACVVGYNYSQNRKVAQRLEKSRAGMASVVTEEQQRSKGPGTAGAARAEPVLTAIGAVSAGSHFSEVDVTIGGENSSQVANLEPGEVMLGNITQPSSSSAEKFEQQPLSALPASDPYMLRSFGLHPSADCIVEIHYPVPVASDRLLSASGGVRRVGAKPVIFEGVAADGEFEPLVPGERFVGLRVGVLMANRHGPLNAMEFSDFAALIQKVADATGGKLEMPDMNEVLHRARTLDAKCAELDAQIGLNVVVSEALSPADLAAAAREFGLTERGNNRFAKLGEHGEVLFSFSLADAPNRITLMLDVPRAPLAANPWLSMLDCAKRTVARFGGRLVDDADKGLTADSLDRIGIQLNGRYQSLVAASFDAGSPVSLRLFN